MIKEFLNYIHNHPEIYKKLAIEYVRGTKKKDMIKASLLDEIFFNEDYPALHILVNTPFTKEIRITMRAGQTLPEKANKYPIMISVVQGKLELNSDGHKMDLGRGEIISLEPETPHSLIAKEESIIRLTITKSERMKE